MTERYILVTGGAGYIGSHTCKALAINGFSPVTFDNLSTGDRSLVKWGRLIQGDLRDTEKLREAFSTYNFEGVIHFAAKAYVGESVKQPIDYFEANISTTTNLLKTMKEFGVSKIIFSSSCATYGDPKSDSIAEDVAQNPINPYGFSKLASEKLIKYASEAHGLKYSILRYFNAAGADPEGELGELHSPETHLIPQALKAASRGSTFKIFGGDYETRDGTAIRDYIHVSDLANCHILALNKLLKGEPSFTCNLGTGLGFSVLEVVEQIKVRYPKFEFVIEPRRAGDPDSLVANVTFSESYLRPDNRYSDLNTILETALAWELRNYDNFQ